MYDVQSHAPDRSVSDSRNHLLDIGMPIYRFKHCSIHGLQTTSKTRHKRRKLGRFSRLQITPDRERGPCYRLCRGLPPIALWHKAQQDTFDIRLPCCSPIGPVVPFFIVTPSSHMDITVSCGDQCKTKKVSWTHFLVDSSSSTILHQSKFLMLLRGTQRRHKRLTVVSRIRYRPSRAIGPKRDPVLVGLPCHQGARFLKDPVCFRHYEAPGYREPRSSRD